MALLLAGVTVWFTVHLFPAIAPASRENMVFKLGENAYKGLFSLLILAALLAAQPRSIHDPGLQLSFAAVAGLTAAADPPEDPPGTVDVSHGLRVGP